MHAVPLPKSCLRAQTQPAQPRPTQAAELEDRNPFGEGSEPRAESPSLVLSTAGHQLGVAMRFLPGTMPPVVAQPRCPHCLEHERAQPPRSPGPNVTY